MRFTIHYPSWSQQKGALRIHLLLSCIHRSSPPQLCSPAIASLTLVLMTTQFLESWEHIRVTIMEMKERGWTFLKMFSFRLGITQF